jgi:hypothetical protein
MSARRCTCWWEEGYTTGRRFIDPLCPAKVLHVDDEQRLAAQVEDLLESL